MERARENDLKSVGFCILSAGIFRGGCSLKVVIEKGLETIAKNTYPGFETVVFCGFSVGSVHAAGADRALRFRGLRCVGVRDGERRSGSRVVISYLMSLG